MGSDPTGHEKFMIGWGLTPRDREKFTSDPRGVLAQPCRRARTHSPPLCHKKTTSSTRACPRRSSSSSASPSPGHPSTPSRTRRPFPATSRTTKTSTAGACSSSSSTHATCRPRTSRRCAGGRASSWSAISAQATRPPSCPLAGSRRPPRTSRPTRRCCLPPSTGSVDPSCRRPRRAPQGGAGRYPWPRASAQGRGPGRLRTLRSRSIAG
jgi:hypothetical protein